MVKFHDPSRRKTDPSAPAVAEEQPIAADYGSNRFTAADAADVAAALPYWMPIGKFPIH